MANHRLQLTDDAREEKSPFSQHIGDSQSMGLETVGLDGDRPLTQEELGFLRVADVRITERRLKELADKV